MKKINHNKLNKVGAVSVFTVEGAAEAYKTAVKTLNERGLDMAGSIYLANAADDLHRIGFSWDEIEALEIAAIA